MKPNAESKIRKIIREELDFYFSKLSTKLDEISFSNNNPIIESKKTVSEETVSKQRKDLRSKFGTLMSSISEGIDLEEKQDYGVTAEMLQGNSKLKHLESVFTKDYSQLLKKMDEK